MNAYPTIPNGRGDRCQNDTKPKPIVLYRGDDTDFMGNQDIKVSLDTELDLTGCTVHFTLLGLKRVITELDEGYSFTLTFSRDDTKDFPTGEVYAALWIEDAQSRRRTVADNIRFIITNNAQFAYHDSEQFITLVIEGSIPNVEWQNIENKPTTLSGYGITDAVKTVNNVAPDANGNVEVEGGDEGLAPEFVANQFYAYGELVKHEGVLYKCDALNGYSGEWNGEYFSTTTASAALQDIRQMAAQKRFVARFYEGAGETFKVNDIRWRDFGQYGTLQRCTNGGDAETAEWEDTTIGDVLALISETSGSWTRQYVVVSGTESDEEMPTLMDFGEGRIVYDSGDEEQMPTAQELLGGDMVAELYMAGENRQGIEIFHDGTIIVKPYGGEMQVYEWSVVISEIMPELTVLAKIYAAVQGDSEKPILIIELS